MTNALHLGADIVKDSHFLLADTELLPVPPGPTESAVQLTGTFAIDPGSQGMALALAQIVIAEDSPVGTVVMTGQAANREGVKFTTNALIPIPEPVTLALLGLGGLFATRRRR